MGMDEEHHECDFVLNSVIDNELEASEDWIGQR